MQYYLVNTPENKRFELSADQYDTLQKDKAAFSFDEATPDYYLLCEEKHPGVETLGFTVPLSLIPLTKEEYEMILQTIKN